MRISRLLLLLQLLAAACSGPPAGTLARTIDSTGDTVVVRFSGSVPEGAIHPLVEELRIAPASQDTSLFAEVGDFEVDRAGGLWVYDRTANLIFRFDSEGRLVQRIGREGAGPGELRSATGMVALPDSGVAIWDSRNARITRFDFAGNLRASITIPAGFASSDGLMTDRTGRLYVRYPVAAPRDGDFIGLVGLVGVRPEGGFRDSLLPPRSEVPTIEYRAERSSGGGRSVSSTGPEFGARSLWRFHPDGFFVVAHGGDYQILLARSPQPLIIERTLVPVPTSEAERANERDRIIWSMRQTDPAWSWKGAALPEAKAPLMDLSVTRDGRLWARIAVPSEPVPEAERDVPRNRDQPVRRFRTPVAYEVFSPDGEFLGRIELPARTRLVEADGNLLWALARDPDGLPAVVRFRIEPPLP